MGAQRINCFKKMCDDRATYEITKGRMKRFTCLNHLVEATPNNGTITKLKK